MTKDADALISAITTPMFGVLTSRGITMESLARDLKRELKAKETKIFKVKRGLIELPNAETKIRRYRTIMATNEEIVIAVSHIAWGVRQSARQDAQKLLNLYPPERHELSGPGGKPVEIGGTLGDIERSARLIFLLEQAEKRAKDEKCKP